MLSLSPDPERSFRSKIARLPFKIREEVNELLLDGVEGNAILYYLNNLPGIPHDFSHQNLSGWRKSGYAAWLQDRKQIEAIKARGELALRLAESGGADVASGAAAILGGQILDAICDIDRLDLDDDDGRNKFLACVSSVTRLQQSTSQERRAKVAERTLDQRERQLDQREREINLNEEKFRKLTVEKIMEAAKSPQIQAILGNANLAREEQLKTIEQLMFGDQAPIYD